MKSFKLFKEIHFLNHAVSAQYETVCSSNSLWVLEGINRKYERGINKSILLEGDLIAPDLYVSGKGSISKSDTPTDILFAT